MFETFKGAEVMVPHHIQTEMRFWPFVSKPFPTPWFYATYLFGPTNLAPKILLLSNPDDLAPEAVLASAQLQELNLVSPGWINGSDRWRMDPLLELWRGLDSEGCLAFRYVLEDGRAFSTLKRNETLRDGKLICRVAS